MKKLILNVFTFGIRKSLKGLKLVGSWAVELCLVRRVTLGRVIFSVCLYDKMLSLLNPFSPSPLSTLNFSLHNTYKIRHLVIRKWELIKQSKLLKIKNKILSNLFNEKYELKLGEFNNTTWNVACHVFQFEKHGGKISRKEEEFQEFQYIGKRKY